ncbi:hypothetical protein SUGI_0325170 [Cryptomeria japonica]|uniref:heterogeneous nuclear ribonucleoprotein 1 n=1 Tax=Cryptomeria japonica TaxID=3369 RepID=UPI002408E143|nr:heterogeneous nuclear ribonucleoprotein 1 [Cryptomeria japonica]XP_057857935.1 heterogeneous nuclear ribonucleoprotein 1 [Cryptomeria japonica]XP_057857936.1 heterogeneous nuclear ribonucleoprotein 1 [Cryptomeria japonica]XP_057857937.1 heterogeneous nuclear ribonucleoprotein 1 [Cryptomeria japonica]GLJ18371.1 hypothetical protein SUGI_0325170 [Cryptomeria japonica]
MDTEQGKVFIGGISWETNEETLKDYFKAYGEVAETVIMRDRMTGRARGFGFIGFADPNVVERVLQDKHTIDGRQVELKRAVPREEQQRNAQMKNSGSNMGVGGPRTKKIFVGGLAPTVTEDDFRKYFEQFGNITDVVVMYDHVSQRPRGFGFITFDTEDAVDKVVTKNFHQLHDKMVEVKRALPKEMSPGGARARSSPGSGFGGAPTSRYGAPAPPPAGRGGYAPYGGAVPGYFPGGYGAPGVNGGGYGAAAGAAPPPPAYGGAPAGYAGGAYATGYGNPAYGAGAPAPYASAPMAGGYAAAAPGGASAPWGSAMQTSQGAGAGYGYGSGPDAAAYGGGYGSATGTGAYVPPSAGGVSAGYQGGTGDVYGGQGYGDQYNAPPSGAVPTGGYAMGGPVQADSGVNGSPGYGAAGRQTQRVADARFRPYPASGDRAS